MDVITMLAAIISFLVLVLYFVYGMKEAPLKNPFFPDDVYIITRIIQNNMPNELCEEFFYSTNFYNPFDWLFVDWSDDEENRRAVALYLDGAKLSKEMDVSGLTELVRLDCQNNELTSLTLTRLPKLKVLNCYDNQLVSLDLSKLPRLTSLDCSNNRLLSITLPKGARLNDLTCLYCSDDRSISLVMPKSVRLRTFYCRNNPLVIIDAPWRTRLTSPVPPNGPDEKEKQDIQEEAAE